MTFDPSKPVQTRSGRPARILCTDRKGRWPIVALVLAADGEEKLHLLDKNGESRGTDWHRVADDLVNIPERRPHADLIIAWANGAKIEMLLLTSNIWVKVDSPDWGVDYQYRIAPTKRD